jgi:hypothetical protein
MVWFIAAGTTGLVARVQRCDISIRRVGRGNDFFYEEREAMMARAQLVAGSSGRGCSESYSLNSAACWWWMWKSDRPMLRSEFIVCMCHCYLRSNGGWANDTIKRYVRKYNSLLMGVVIKLV